MSFVAQNEAGTTGAADRPGGLWTVPRLTRRWTAWGRPGAPGSRCAPAPSLPTVAWTTARRGCPQPLGQPRGAVAHTDHRPDEGVCEAGSGTGRTATTPARRAKVVVVRVQRGLPRGVGTSEAAASINQVAMGKCSCRRCVKVVDVGQDRPGMAPAHDDRRDRAGPQDGAVAPAEHQHKRGPE